VHVSRLRSAVLALVVAAVVIGTLLVGRSGPPDPGSDDSPTPSASASLTPGAVPADTFCLAFASLQSTLREFTGGTGAVEDVQTNAERVRALLPGTAMPGPARDGLTYVLDLLTGLEPAATADDLAAADDDATEQDTGNATAFGVWENRTCSGA
jgi:hypothetical protein